jgi:hypothetical protein
MWPFSAVTKIFVSSANQIIFASWIFIGRSWMYNKNNIGSRIDPCGTLFYFSQS